VKACGCRKRKKEKLEIEAHAKQVSAVTLTIEARSASDKMFGSSSKDNADGGRSRLHLRPAARYNLLSRSRNRNRDRTDQDAARNHRNVTVRVLKKQELSPSAKRTHAEE